MASTVMNQLGVHDRLHHSINKSTDVGGCVGGGAFGPHIVVFTSIDGCLRACPYLVTAHSTFYSDDFCVFPSTFNNDGTFTCRGATCGTLVADDGVLNYAAYGFNNVTDCIYGCHFVCGG